MMQHFLFSCFLIAGFGFAYGQISLETIDESDFVIGKTITFDSEILGEQRQINVYLPASYHPDSAQAYPVIYLLDGSKDEDFIHVAGIVQFGSFPWIKMVPESIVVGIANVDRKRDFTGPSDNELGQKEFPTAGHSAQFIQFIASELQPFVETRFRASGQNTIIGQSLGGLLATEILFTHSHLFDHYIIVSPSLWWNDEAMLSANPKPFNTPKTIYIAVGKEGEVMERTARALYEKLNTKKGDKTEIYFKFLEDKTHGDALHMAVYFAFEIMFS